MLWPTGGGWKAPLIRSLLPQSPNSQALVTQNATLTHFGRSHLSFYASASSCEVLPLSSWLLSMQESSSLLTLMLWYTAARQDWSSLLFLSWIHRNARNYWHQKTKINAHTLCVTRMRITFANTILFRSCGSIDINGVVHILGGHYDWFVW